MSSAILAAGSLLDEGKAAEGIALLQAALAEDHRHVPTLIAYAEALRRYGVLSYAEQAALMALELEPESVEANLSLSRTLYELGRTEEALKRIDALLGRAPRLEPAVIFKAGILKAMGRFDTARALLVEAIDRNPRSILAFSALAQIKRFTADSPFLVKMEALAASVGDDAHFAPALHYALGKALEDIGDHDRAFACFDHGAALKRARTHYDEADMLRYFDETIHAFGPELAAAAGAEPASTAVRPVFIVGMPRSGSTLIERILAAHPQVRSEGERRSFSESLAAAAPPGDEDPIAAARRMGPDDWARLGAIHRAHLASAADGARILVNKLPGNLFLVGAIHCAMPEARFIVSERDPIDTCLSAFTTSFAYHVPWSYDLAEIGRFHRGCDRLAEHWRAILPAESIRTVRYEDLVADPELEAGALTDFIGLDWDPACLAFDRSDDPVRTASVAQVRRPIYASSIGRWRRYERHLQPLIEALGIARAAG